MPMQPSFIFRLAAVLPLGVSAVIIFALGLQWNLLVHYSRTDGVGILETLLKFFSYFTVLTNLLILLVFAASPVGTRSQLIRAIRSPLIRGGICASSLLMMFIYEVFLRGRTDPQGWQFVASLLLHDLVPGLYFLHWILTPPKGELRPACVGLWAVYPAVYSVWLVGVGEVFQIYPYSFLNFSAVGYAAALRVAFQIGFLFATIGLALVGIDRLCFRGIRRLRGRGYLR